MTSKVSVLDLYRSEIEEFVKTGASLRSIWKILSSKMPDDVQISYVGFYRYCKRKGLK
ncbi:MAG: hypothetical protein WCY75_12500 [Sulfurimonadaceae bacterium]|jgi:hypothetical protein|uniref:hypothetical protein n=1 Tax=Campylobacterales TaxID=213849 RepID=UPI000AD3DDCD